LSKQIQEINGLNNKTRFFKAQNNLLQYVYPVIEKPRIYLNRLRDPKVDERRLV